MSANRILKDLHNERIARQKKASEAKVEEPFECPVCYTNGVDSGIVTPKCGHKLCVTCYSTILIEHTKKAKCPCCRTKYLGSNSSDDEYADMPDLIQIDPLHEIIRATSVDYNINYLNILQNMQITTDRIILFDETYRSTTL